MAAPPAGAGAGAASAGQDAQQAATTGSARVVGKAILLRASSRQISQLDQKGLSGIAWPGTIEMNYKWSGLCGDGAQ